MKFLSFLFSIAFFVPVLLRAQLPAWTHYTDKEGLPNNEVYDLFQDSRGFIWIGTLNGLSRFDGVRFERFSSPDQIATHISGITEDAEGKIWGQNFNNQLFFVEDGALHEFKDWKSRTQSNFAPFVFSENNTLLTSDDNDIISFQFNDSTWSKLAGAPNNNTFNIRPFVSFLSKNDSIYRFVSPKYGFASIEKNHIRRMKLSRKDSLFLIDRGRESVLSFAAFFIKNRPFFAEFSSQKPFLFEIVNDSAVYRPELSHQIGSVFKGYLNISSTSDGLTWISTNNRMSILNPDFTLNTTFENKLPKHRITEVLVDSEKNIWFSTLGYGVFMIKNFDVNIINQQSGSIPANYVTRLLELDSKTLVFGDKSGTLHFFDMEKNRVFRSLPSVSTQEVTTIGKSPLSETLYFTSYDLWKLAPGYTSANRFLTLGLVKDISFDSFENIFISSVWNAHLLLNDQSRNRYSYLTKWALESKAIGKDSLFKLTFGRTLTNWIDEKENVFWLAGNQKLEVFSTKGRFEITDKDGNALVARILHQDKSGIMWAGTENGGVYGFTENVQKYHLNHKNGLRSNTIRSLASSDSTLWIGTTNGLNRVHLSNGRVDFFNHFDGLPSNDIFHIAISQSLPVVWLATAAGIVQFPRDFDGENRRIPPIYIQSVAVNGNLVDVENRLSFPHTQNNLTVHFQSPQFKSAGNFSFEYRLRGRDAHWITTSAASNFVHYSALSAGDYFFEVVAVNEDGVRSEQPAILRFNIQLPFWKEWWFVVLLFVGLGTATYQILNYRFVLYRRETELQLKNQQAERDLRISQLASIRAQMNPHFIFNALNSIQSYIFSDDKRKANELIGKFSELIRTILSHSEREFITLDEEIKALTIYIELENDRHAEKFEFLLDIDPAVNRFEVRIPPMLIQPFVENSIKHGFLHKKTGCKLAIHVSWEQPDQLLRVVIDDNGIGRKKSASINHHNRLDHNRFAIKANSKRLEILNREKTHAIGVDIIDRENSDGEATGTVVILHIPVEKE